MRGPAAHRLRGGRRPAAGADGPLRRSARPARAGRAQCAPGLAVVRRPGLRGGRRRRPRHTGALPGVGEGHRRRAARRGGPGGPDRRAARARRGLPARPRPGRDPRLVLRRHPGRARGAAAARRLPRGGGRRPAHRPAAVRHALHRALSRAPGGAGRGLRPQFGGHRRRDSRTRGARTAFDDRSRFRRRQCSGGEYAAPVDGTARRGPAARGSAALGRHHAHDSPGAGGGKPPPAPGRLPPAHPHPLDLTAGAYRRAYDQQDPRSVYRAYVRQVAPVLTRLVRTSPTSPPHPEAVKHIRKTICSMFAQEAVDHAFFLPHPLDWKLLSLRQSGQLATRQPVAASQSSCGGNRDDEFHRDHGLRSAR
ncbi:hypothetical protein SBRY_10642 [Actinacidiphila bryophytorum]|uniref:Uncharacterized protein n=1 Tax=Actinacidiphila bryophytorum TaxID=1436133 RepID=A0A9W4E248_9ACTN|nr:hypothetical protein SBRY_10642 [Actinacidiphila bryophytorum]